MLACAKPCYADHCSEMDYACIGRHEEVAEERKDAALVALLVADVLLANAGIMTAVFTSLTPESSPKTASLTLSSIIIGALNLLGGAVFAAFMRHLSGRDNKLFDGCDGDSSNPGCNGTDAAFTLVAAQSLLVGFVNLWVVLSDWRSANLRAAAEQSSALPSNRL